MTNLSNTTNDPAHPIAQLEAVSKIYGAVHAVDHVSLTVARGEVLALLGPSGCGKTSTLRLLAGLETPDHGTVQVAGRVVAGAGVWVAAEDRGVGMVFQDYALFPHLTVAQNIAFGLNKWNKAERTARVQKMLALTALSPLAGRFPHQLSGGQQQRVALARSLATDPPLLLLDEPFASLDATLRDVVRSEVRHILKESGVAAVLVTHDQTEALSMADRIAVMTGGRVLQVDTPQMIYRHPASVQVARLVGEANIVRGMANGATAFCELGTIRIDAEKYGEVDLMIRPEMLTLVPDPAGTARIDHLRYFGHDQMVSVMLPSGASLRARLPASIDIVPGAATRIEIQGMVRAYTLDE
jgi:iron(III) transport system ATP-binding protein